MNLSVLTRNRVIDLLRGYFLLIIGVDHAYLNPNLWNTFSGENVLWVSAAEGFFFVSGMMVGLVRGRQIDTRGWRKVIIKLYQRAAILYVWTIGLTITFTTVGWLINDPSRLKTGLYAGDFWHMVLESMSLRYVYGWTDFLPYYIVFLLFSPLVLWMIRQRLEILVVAASLSLWAEGRQNPFLAWQLLFTFGTVVGYHLPVILKKFELYSSLGRRLVIGSLSGLSVLTLGLSIVYVHFPSWSSSILFLTNRSNIDWLMDKATVGPGRVILFGLWFMALYLAVQRYESAIYRFLGWLLVPLGRNSLGTYIAEAAVIFGLKTLFPAEYSWWGNSMWIALELTIVWLIINANVAYAWLLLTSRQVVTTWSDRLNQAS